MIMNDLAYAFTIYFATLGPLKTVPAFYAATQGADRRTIATLAAKSTIVATLVVLFVAFSAVGTLAKWRVTVDAILIAGGIMLLIASVRTLSTFTLVELPENAPAAGTAALSTRWMGRPVLSPLAIPAIVPPIGVVVILVFAGLAVGNPPYQMQLAGLLLGIMAANFLAMLFAKPIMRVVGFPVLQVTGWVFSALQGGLAVQAIVNALRSLAAGG
jgi:multiple antibiotic resistance protein